MLFIFTITSETRLPSIALVTVPCIIPGISLIIIVIVASFDIKSPSDMVKVKLSIPTYSESGMY